MMAYQLEAYTDCNHGAGLTVLYPAYYHRICTAGAKKFARFAVQVWGISAGGKREEELARAGVEALAGFIKEIGLPSTLRELGITEETPLEEIAASVPPTSGGYGKRTCEDVLSLFQECF